jgi:hypothetical protein
MKVPICNNVGCTMIFCNGYRNDQRERLHFLLALSKAQVPKREMSQNSWGVVGVGHMRPWDGETLAPIWPSLGIFQIWSNVLVPDDAANKG